MQDAWYRGESYHRNDTTAVDPFLLKTNVADMERYTGIPVVAVVPPYQGQISKGSTWLGPLIY